MPRPLAPASLRGRLALLFTAGSAVILILAGGLIYLDLNGQLQRTINSSLLDRAHDIEADVRSGRVEIRQEEAFAQILGPVEKETKETREAQEIARKILLEIPPTPTIEQLLWKLEGGASFEERPAYLARLKRTSFSGV